MFLKNFSLNKKWKEKLWTLAQPKVKRSFDNTVNANLIELNFVDTFLLFVFETFLDLLHFYTSVYWVFTFVSASNGTFISWTFLFHVCKVR